jgi:hypothetical protein
MHRFEKMLHVEQKILAGLSCLVLYTPQAGRTLRAGGRAGPPPPPQYMLRRALAIPRWWCLHIPQLGQLQALCGRKPAGGGGPPSCFRSLHTIWPACKGPGATCGPLPGTTTALAAPADTAESADRQSHTAPVDRGAATQRENGCYPEPEKLLG